ncbi:hypothetical protein Tco_1576262 [Tanacetum coccineum]
MAMTIEIKYAPQCGDMIVESVLFSSNNFVGNFNYPQSFPTYKDICKFLRNYLLVEAFMKTPIVLYQNYLREFWCTTVVEDPNQLTNDSEAHPLKEFTIKFTVKNVQTPLMLYNKTIYETTKLDYNKGNYVAHVSPKNPSKVTQIELMASMIDVINLESLVTPLPSYEKKGKKKSQIVTQPKPKSQGSEASRALPQKRKKSKTQTTYLVQTIVKPPKEKIPTEDSNKTLLIPN